MKINHATPAGSLLVILLYYGCDLGVSEQNEYKPAVHTITVNEHQSNLPLEGVSVGVSVEFNDGSGGSSYYGTTDANGIVAIESPHGTVTELRAIKPGYVDYCNLQFQSPVILKPVAYLMVHLQNDTPAASTDKLVLIYPEAELSCYGGLTGPLTFNGVVNDTLILRCTGGNNLLRWVVTEGSNPQTHSRYNVAIPSGDTTFYEIIY